MIKTLLLTLSCVLLLGCEHTKEIQVVPQLEIQHVVLEPPKELYNKVSKVKPPSPKLYINSDWENKEKLLFDFINKQNVLIDNLLVDRAGITKWVKDNKELVNSKKESP